MGTDGAAARTDAVETSADLADQLLRLTRRMHRAHRHNLDPLGITPAMSRVMSVVVRSEEPPRMVDLAQQLGVVPRAVTTLVDSLEDGGLARRLPDPASRRVVRVELTDAGQAALQAVREARRCAAEELLAPLGPAQRAQLGALLRALEGPTEQG
ncbi:MarR family transcriptional regulator [Streptomyces sp. SL13]|uniref:MarR family transcriptional regulator n=1 Tax=Streptantibioticus silvisoli TaxID=2705255 RepID=A0AA90H1H8_9ACTN|nr:MarR family transcriptional regulator [Streptantibioticus silvisoli]MDI5966262.1 MarR family transcriptional regulator [Streptantibioticus silvisoli]MDI5971604.1 MarR family transcriptional regulator [Streptantibioticus silvisoli]